MFLLRVTNYAAQLGRFVSTLPKYLPPSKNPDQYLKFSYGIFLNNPAYSNLVFGINNPHFKPEGLQNTIKQLIINSGSINIQTLDSKCADYALKLDLDCNFNLLTGFHILCGLNAFEGNFFLSNLKIWEKNLDSVNAEQILLMLFLLAQSRMHQNCHLIPKIVDKLSPTNNYSFQEWVIIAHSLFKMKVKCPHNVLDAIAALVLKENPSDSFCLISLTKAIRLANYYNAVLFSYIEKFLIGNIENLNFAECAHFMALYANSNCYPEILFKALEIRGTDSLKSVLKEGLKPESAHASIRPRCKDLSRFVWSLNHVDSCSASTIRVFKEIMDKMFMNGDFDVRPQHLVDIVQSLCLREIYLDFYLNQVFSPKFVSKCRHLRKNKPLHQLHFVARSVAIEYPQFKGSKMNEQTLQSLAGNLKRLDSKDVANRDGFRIMLNYVDQSDDSSFWCTESPLPHIPIAGIVLNVNQGIQPLPKNWQELNKDVKLTSVEILDQSNCVKGTFKPTGLLATKIRQLEKMNFNVVVVEPGISKEEFFKFIL